ncbi:hypothetical protein EV126DRAFT_37194 [Verticillium dahliae]|nr:hypothetical protein EV126DRAFT_37194 [Verticillium dahliae]
MCCEADGVHLRPSLRHFTDSDDEFDAPVATALTPGEQDPTTLTSDHWAFDGDKWILVSLVRRTTITALPSSNHRKLPVHDRDSIRCGPLQSPTSRPKPQSSARGPHALRLGHQSTPLPRELPISEQKTMGQCLSPAVAVSSPPRSDHSPASWPSWPSGRPLSTRLSAARISTSETSNPHQPPPSAEAAGCL